jgi:signal transduction histidine kinase
MCRMLGYTHDELIGLHASDIIDPAEVPNLGPALRAIKDSSDHHREWQFRRKNGSVFPAEVIATKMPNGIILGMLRDITERKEAEAERAKRQQAEAADRIKSAFLATMSHELRTPLNSIIGFTGIILQGLAGPLNPEQRKQLDMVRGSARHLLALVNDVLDISKIEAGQLEVACEPFDMKRSIAKAIATITPLAQKKKLTLRVQVAPELGSAVSDERRFEQILLNLLSNAIKFTDRGEVALQADQVDDFKLPGATSGQAAVCVRISDTGIGIKPADLACLFQPFRQIDSGLSRNHDGTGLGLAICRRLAELMGGTIGAESTWEHGSTFSVTLPLKGAPRS